jgi:hypothetical protein
MLESYIEKKYLEMVKKRGGMAIKLEAISCAGVPDRVVLMPNGRMFFVELKQEGKKPRPIQLARHKQLRELGYEVYVYDGTGEIPL